MARSKLVLAYAIRRTPTASKKEAAAPRPSVRATAVARICAAPEHQSRRRPAMRLRLQLQAVGLVASCTAWAAAAVPGGVSRYARPPLTPPMLPSAFQRHSPSPEAGKGRAADCPGQWLVSAGG
jgi:hypothetical protein